MILIQDINISMIDSRDDSKITFLNISGTPAQLMRPSTNIYYAGRYLRHQLSRYSDIQKAVIAYNQGSAKQLTTSKYQVRVFKQWGIYANN